MKKNILFLVLSGLIMFNLAGTNISCFGQSETSEVPRIDADRWIEYDLYRFSKKSYPEEVNDLLKRIEPLLRGVDGWRGIIINAGWLTDFVTEWNGDINQPLPIPNNLSRNHITRAEQLFGNTEERIAQANERFETYWAHQMVYYDDWTYRDFKNLVNTLRTAAKEQYGIDNLKVGVMFVGWDRIYSSDLTAFAQSHPEAYKMGVFNSWGTFNMVCKLNADSKKYGAFPKGIPQGKPITEFFGAQWGSVSKAVGLDAIHLRDGFLGSGVYRRTGPYGLHAPPDPEKVKEWSKATADLVKATKLGNPDALVFGYSNAASAVADWRINCMDLETIAKEGHLDAWIDQSWAGESNDFGIRGLWERPDHGWTAHLTTILTHAAILADTKVHHYVLTEGMDSWERGDVLRISPDRLRWGMWAYHHAAVKTPNGLKMPDGSYIAMIARGGEIFSKKEINFMADSLNAAIIDARSTKKIFGPTMVYSRDAMVWQNENAPDKFINEWIDEQMAGVIKWAVPCMSITRSEWLSQIETDMPVIQTPVHLPEKQIAYISNLIDSGKPVAIFGSGSGGIDPKLAKLVGIKANHSSFAEPVNMHRALLSDPDSPYIDEVPYRFSFLWQFNQIDTIGYARSIYKIGQSSPLVVQNTNSRKTLFWDPLLLEVLPEPKWENKPLIEWIKSTYPYFLTARVMHDYLKDSDSPWVDNIKEDSPVPVHAWQLNDGSYRVLAGNTEVGLRIPHHRDRSEHIVVQIPQSWLGESGALKMTDLWKNKTMGEVKRSFKVDLEQAECAVFGFDSK